ncbi:MAG: metallophosphoesterase [Candidatus Solibacter usitatus]|nr:metallophosphoesterase [Candidatus Solibacter usitatus]
MGRGARVALGFFIWAAAGLAQEFHVYVGQITADSVLLAWGKAAGSGNVIGRDSVPWGKASVKVGERTVAAERNWAMVEGLAADTEYPYQITLNGVKIGEGQVRTYPQRARRLTFFVIGDWGSGDSQQYRVAEAMWNEFSRRQDPVRFVLTTGDNIYADTVLGMPAGGSGNRDRHWRKKFFLPYERLLRRIPFYPSPGNHDGNESEGLSDLDVYLDNFFFPGNRPARYYQFSFGGLADFFSLDSTENTTHGLPAPFYLEEGEQFGWMQQAMAASKARWKIPYFHHAVLTAGPEHPPMVRELAHWAKLFVTAGVKVVFNGHEHNFQFSERNPATGGICWVVTGAGGQSRPGNIAKRMAEAQIAGWSAAPHFLVVEIEDRTMRITPVGTDGEAAVTDSKGGRVRTPIEVK